jgi:hypothetical protein
MTDRSTVWLIWGTRFSDQHKDLYAVVESEDEAREAVAYLEDGKDTSTESYSCDEVRLGLPYSHLTTSIRHFKRENEELYYLLDPVTKEWWRYFLTPAQAAAFDAKTPDHKLVRAETAEEAFAALLGDDD